MNTEFTRYTNGASLAYLGDAVLEVYVRRYLVRLGITDNGELNRLALRFVKATAQSQGMERLLPLLTEEEEYLYKRGRNAHGLSAPKSASAVEYRRATGMEALFAALDLAGEHERAAALFAAAYADVIARIEQEKGLAPMPVSNEKD